MSEIGLVPAAQSEALLREVEQQTDDDCRSITEVAEREARALLAQTHANARRRMHEAIEELRREARHRRTQAVAQRETALRMQAQQRAAATINQTWPLLNAALAARWRDPTARAAWTKAAAGHARERLRGDRWTVRHPADWSADDGRLLREALGLDDGTQIAFVADGELESGLTIEVAQATLDATPKGLLADPAEIAALLLAEIDRDLPPSGPASEGGGPR